MRPVKLTLEGFTSFAARAEVDFRPLDLFAIVGQTGAGKSSILDGILFALFGESSRKVGVGELRTQGAPAMKVQLEFAVGDREFLVSRVYRGKSAVEFQFHERAGAEWKLVTAQAKQGSDEISRIIGLDFEGFTRAVILPQGAFDEFLRGSTEKRTRILTDLLNLNLYQTMMQSANARAARLRDEIAMLKRQLEHDFQDATAHHRAELEERIAAVQNAVEANRLKQEELAPVRERMAELRRVRQSAKQANMELDAARREQQGKAHAREETNRVIEEAEGRKSETERQLAQSGFEPNVYEQLIEVTPLARQIELLKSELTQRRLKQKEKAAARLAVDSAARAAQTALGAAGEELGVKSYEEARRKYGSREVAARLAADLKAAQIGDAAARESRFRISLEQTERELEHLRAADLRSHLKAGEPCPVCEQIVKNLPKFEAGDTVDAARNRRDESQRDWNAFQVALEKWRDKQQQAEALVGDVADPSGALEALASKLEDLERAGQHAEAALRETDTHAAEAARLDEEIRNATEKLRASNQEFLKYPQWNILPFDELEENLKQQRGNKARHEDLLRQRDDAAKAHVKALEHSSRVQAELLFLEKSIHEKEAQAEASAARVTELESDLRPWLSEEDRVEQTAHALVEEGNTLRQALGQCESRLENIIEKLKRAAEIDSEIESKTGAEQRYRELGTLLNARNFIAYVQRQMLERLAMLASEQLRTLSDGRYTLTLSQESNDFFVEDQWSAGAVRSAKTLSGGESFLASLSLALALSDSVTGFGQQARLESLFLDEGFSTLDAESLQTAIEAVQMLASSRRMVGVISHLPQLAEQMPARILVDKSSSGSTVRIDNGTAAQQRAWHA